MKQAPPASTTNTPHSAAVGTGTMGNKLLVILALLSAVAPLSIDLYLPAFPAMSEDLSTSTSAVQLTLTAFLVGITIGQLIFGPLSDRFGRLRPLLIGAVLCVVASIAAVIAPNVAILVAARLVQGIGGAAGMVIGRAIISDVAHGKAAARAFSLMMIVGGIAPVIAPMVGGFLVDPIGWRGILTVVLGLAVIMLACVVAGIRETFPALRRAELKVLREQSGSPNAALRSREFLSYTLTFGFSFAVMMAYISASPFVYQDMMGLSSMAYGIAFGCNAFALMIVSGIAARLTATHSVRGMLATGVGLMTASLVLAVMILPFIAATMRDVFSTVERGRFRDDAAVVNQLPGLIENLQLHFRAGFLRGETNLLLLNDDQHILRSCLRLLPVLLEWARLNQRRAQR